MSRREKEKARSLDALGRIAYAAGSAPAPAPRPPAAKPAPAARPKAPPPPAPPRVETAADRLRKKQMAERKAKLDEERALRERRSGELVRSARIDRSRIDPFNIPASIRRTGFDRDEPSVAQKLQDILGEARMKESREKMRDKGRRQGGR